MSIWLPLKNNFSDWIHTIYGESSKIVIEDTVAWFAHEECHYTGYGMPACLNLYVIIQQTSNKFFTTKINLCELQLLLKIVLYSLKGILLPFFLWSMHGYWSCGWLLLFLSHLKVLLKVQCSKLATIVCLNPLNPIVHFWLHHTAHCAEKIVSARWFCVSRKGGTGGGGWGHR